MSPTDPTKTVSPNPDQATASVEASDSALDAGLAAAFAPPSVDATAEYPGHAEHVGAILGGKYKLIEAIGEGGMGSVYMAQQTEPVKRLVAVKVIKAGMDSKAVLARFEAERQALAMMDHPNIARVLDAGTTESGRPYFVMELVKGIPITQFCDERKLTPRQRLELFVPVCNAIQHAHMKGVIHRDIKPSNVLVALYDDRPVPKVIDFGIAKATGPALTDHSLMTGFGAVVGTPEYMSPEQASLNNLDIDTRSDVYSLGVLLYELLTGTTPVDRKSLGRAAILEILRIVREVEAPRPSAKLSTIDTLPSVAANRGTEPAKLSKLMKGELDWVLLKALEKDRTRRYDSANGFARDLQRYLADEVVEARPPSCGYRLRKFVKRNKGQVIAAGLVLFALLAGVVGTTWGMMRANQYAEGERQARIEAQEERTNAVQASEAETRARLEAQAQTAIAREATAAEMKAREQTQQRLDQLKKSNSILTLIFMDLNLDMVRKETLDQVLRKRLVDAGKQLNAASVGDPRSVALLQFNLATAILSLGSPHEALPLFEQSFPVLVEHEGRNSNQIVFGKRKFARCYEEIGRFDKAAALYDHDSQDMLAILMQPTNPQHDRDFLTRVTDYEKMMTQVGKQPKALAIIEQLVAAAKDGRGPDHPTTLGILGFLAASYEKAGLIERALAANEELLRHDRTRFENLPSALAYRLGRVAQNHRLLGNHAQMTSLVDEAAQLLSNPLPKHSDLATLYEAAGQIEKALAYHERSYAERRSRSFGSETATAEIHNAYRRTLREAYAKYDRYDRAIEILKDEIAFFKTKNGADSQVVLRSMDLLGHYHLLAHRNPEAITVLEEALGRSQQEFGNESPVTARVMRSLGAAYAKAGLYDKALALFRECVPLCERTLGPNHAVTYDATLFSSIAVFESGKRNDAIRILKDLLARQRTALADSHPTVIANVTRIAEWYAEVGQYDAVQSLVQASLTAVASQKEVVLKLKMPLLRIHTIRGLATEAVGLAKEMEIAARQVYPPGGIELAKQQILIAYELLRVRKYEIAATLLRDAQSVRERVEPDAWTTFNMQSMLGGALLGQKKYADAEPLLVKGYEGMKAREKAIPPQGSTRIPEALDRLVELYTATNKPDAAKKYRDLRAKYPPELAPPPRPLK